LHNADWSTLSAGKGCAGSIDRFCPLDNQKKKSEIKNERAR
jgi:hypothetical protein